LSLFVPGLGQLYSGRPKRALTIYFSGVLVIFIFLMSGLLRIFAGLIALVLAVVMFSVWVVWDAIRIARRSGDYSPRWFNRWYWYLAAWLLASLVAPRLLALSPVRTFWIPSGSMEPALLLGDHLCADLAHYRSAKPVRGDIALLHSPENPTLLVTERVIGLAGEVIEIRNKSVFLDGRPFRDPWGQHTDARVYPASGPSSPLGLRDNFGPLRIPTGMVFVLGDNRDNSYDSRFYGPVPTASLTGRPLYLYWSHDKSRIGRAIK